MDTGFTSVNNRIDKLELKLEKHIEQDKHEHQQLMQMIKELDKEVVQIKRIK